MRVTEVVGRGTVIDSSSHGPQLCFMVAQSLPPQGEGLPLVNWDWSTVTGSLSRGGTTWGDYLLNGTYDGSSLTMTRPPESLPENPSIDGRGETPCVPPAGGWVVRDITITTHPALEITRQAAHRLPDFVDVWVEPIPDAEGVIRFEGDLELADPATLIITVLVLHDVTGAEDALRHIWGGALCVSQVHHTQRDLSSIQTEISNTNGMLTLYAARGHVRLHVIYDDGTLQDTFDNSYGPGAVVVTSALRPCGDEPITVV